VVVAVEMVRPTGGCGVRVVVEVRVEWHRGTSWSRLVWEGSLGLAVLITALPGRTCSTRACAARAELGHHRSGMTLVGGPSMVVRVDATTDRGPG
jgi:hypothetical protein